MDINGKTHADTNNYIKRINRLLMQQNHRLGFIPLIPLIQTIKIGESNHYGGTFPMRARTERYNESDCLGRPHGLNRIHLVDASIFPSVPAQSITLTSMANAYRIGYTAEL